MTISDALNDFAAARQSRILSPYLGYRVRNAANDSLSEQNPRVTEPRASVARSGEITLPAGPGGFDLPFHANPNSAEAQHDHG